MNRLFLKEQMMKSLHFYPSNALKLPYFRKAGCFFLSLQVQFLMSAVRMSTLQRI